MENIEELRQEMIKAEKSGMAGHLSGRCSWRVWRYWNLGNRTIFLLTNDEDHDASMLTEGLMDELMIVERSSE